MKVCKPCICLDGCFLKTLIRGTLLSTIGSDRNNQMFLICWVVVKGENENSQRWFLEHLLKDINIVDGLGLTIVSDQQNGLAKAIKDLVPYAEF